MIYCKNDLNEYTLNHGIIEVIQAVLEIKAEQIPQKSKYNSLVFEMILLINLIFTLRSQPRQLMYQCLYMLVLRSASSQASRFWRTPTWSRKRAFSARLSVMA